MSRGRCYHGKPGKQGRCPAGSLQLSPAQVQLPPGERLQGVLVQTHLAPRLKQSWTSGDDVVSSLLLRNATQTHIQHRRRCALAKKTRSTSPADGSAEADFLPPHHLVSGVLYCRLHLTLPTMLRATEETSARCVASIFSLACLLHSAKLRNTARQGLIYIEKFKRFSLLVFERLNAVSDHVTHVTSSVQRYILQLE